MSDHTAGAPSGLIHDIGYRHYTGPRLGRASIARALYAHNLRALYGLGRTAKSKVIPFLLTVFLAIPALGSIAITAFATSAVHLIPYSTYAIALQPLIALFLAAQAPVIASRELRSRVIPLYFSRPVGIADFVLAKFAALGTAVFLLISLPLTLLYIGSLITEQPRPWYELGHWALALAGAALFAVVLGGLGLAIAALAPRRGFGVAAVIAVYLMSTAVVGIVQGLSMDSGNEGQAGWAGLFTPFSLVDTVQVTLLDGDVDRRVVGMDALGGTVALAGCAAVVAGCLGIVYLRFRKAGQ